MVLLSCLFVLAAIVTLGVGLAGSGLGLIYASIGCSLAAGLVLMIAVLRSRPEQELATAVPAFRATSPTASSGRSRPRRRAPVAVQEFEGDAGLDVLDEPRVDIGAAMPAVFPIADYDELRVDEIVPLLPELDEDELEMVREKEESGKARNGVIVRIDQLLGRPVAPVKKAPAKKVAAKKATTTKTSTTKKIVAKKAPAKKAGAEGQKAPSKKATTAKKAPPAEPIVLPPDTIEPAPALFEPEVETVTPWGEEEPTQVEVMSEAAATAVLGVEPEAEAEPEPEPQATTSEPWAEAASPPEATITQEPWAEPEVRVDLAAEERAEEEEEEEEPPPPVAEAQPAPVPPPWAE